MKKYWVYVIKSEYNGRVYIGLSSNPQQRLLEHNKGDTKSTKAFRPWRFIYKREIGTRIEARKEEKRLKSGIGREFIKGLY